MRRIVTALLVVGLLLNVQATWGSCSDCCVVQTQACSAASSAMTHCHGNLSQLSLVKSKNNCSCDLLNASSAVTVHQFDQEQGKDLSLHAVGQLGASAILEDARNKASSIGSDFPFLTAGSSSSLPLRI
jgi:hypothetical protein